MRIFIAFCCILVFANAEPIYRLPVPGCVVVELNSQYAECFTHSDGHSTTPEHAEKLCAEKGGRLPIIQHEKMWKILIEKLLKRKGSNVWLGFHIPRNSNYLLPNVDLKNMSSYWQSSNIGQSEFLQYLYARSGSAWTWFKGYSNDRLEYLCQFDVVMQCKTTEITDPKVIIKTCLEETTIPNNTTIEVKCRPGYYLSTNKFITCRNGIWDKAQCVAGCPQPIRRDYSILNTVPTNIKIGDTISYVCEDNSYNWKDFSKTHFAITCQEDSTWSDPEARCSPKQNYTIIPVDASEILTDTITLDCGLTSNNTIWIHNGEKVASKTAFAVRESDGSLRIDLRDTNSVGFYTCHAYNSQKLQIGTGAYRVFGKEEECSTQLEQLQITEKVSREKENVILYCHQDPDDVSVEIKWLKDGEEIVYNSRRNVILGGGLFIQNINSQDGGVYVCKTTRVLKSSTCKYEIVYNLRVIFSAKTMCGLKNATQSKYYQPWLAILWQEDEVEPFCFGTLLNEKWIITSAFCLTHLRRKKNLEGVYAILGWEGQREKFPISLIKIHPNYKTRPNVNDIGLIQLRVDAVNFDENILPACINSRDIGNIHTCDDLSNLTGSVIGWGNQVIDNIDAVTTNIANVKLISKSLCRKLLSYDSVRDKFCTKISDLGDGELGGFGSPFIATFDGRDNLIGVYTWGLKRENDEHYEYFISILNYYDWIATTTLIGD